MTGPWRLLRPHDPGCYCILAIRAKNYPPGTPWRLERAHAIDTVPRGRTGLPTKRLNDLRWLRFACGARNCTGLLIVREDYILKLIEQTGGPGPLTGAPKPRKAPR